MSVCYRLMLKFRPLFCISGVYGMQTGGAVDSVKTIFSCPFFVRPENLFFLKRIRTF